MDRVECQRLYDDGINLPLECFLNGGMPSHSLWDTPWVMWLLPVAFLAAGWVIGRFK